MKKSLLVLAITLSLAACDLLNRDSNADEAVAATYSQYNSSFQSPTTQEIDVEHFVVFTVPTLVGQDMVTLQKITDGRLVVNKIIVNRGRCAVKSNYGPTIMDYASKMSVTLQGCNAEDVLEMQINTDQGYLIYNF